MRCVPSGILIYLWGYITAGISIIAAKSVECIADGKKKKKRAKSSERDGHSELCKDNAIMASLITLKADLLNNLLEFFFLSVADICISIFIYSVRTLYKFSLFLF